MDAYGKKVRITAEDLGEEEFAKWKAWMDADLHEEAKREHIYKNHNVSIEVLPLSRFAVMDRETQMIEEEEREERRKLKEQVTKAFLGVDIQTIQSIVGHADIDMTQHYLHVQESIRKSAVEKFSAAFPCDVETE